MKKYSVEIEISGPLALFSRPDSGGSPTSFPIPTWSAAKGIFESIARLGDGNAWICPTKVEVCRLKSDQRRGAVHYQRYAFNYGGPLRKGSQLSSGSSLQVFSTVLSDVCFRLHAEIRGDKSRKRHSGVNPCHHLQDMFNRRLKRGQCHRTPSLGLSEFTATYWGPFRPEQTEVDEILQLRIPSLLISPFDKPVDGKFNPKFQTNSQIMKGVFEYDS